MGKHEELWKMLEVNTGQDPDFCKSIVMEVVMHKCDKNGDGKLTLKEFNSLHEAVISNPKGQLEFFHEVLFAAYDHTGDSLIDPNELDGFLELFYDKSSIFAGDKRLPPKEELKKRVLAELDKDSDGKLSMNELKPMLVGS